MRSVENYESAGDGAEASAGSGSVKAVVSNTGRANCHQTVNLGRKADAN
jgi:hypothetical protein